MTDDAPLTSRTADLGAKRITIPELRSYGRPVAAIEVDAPGLDFLIAHLPADDGFTRHLEQLRDRARIDLWASM